MSALDVAAAQHEAQQYLQAQLRERAPDDLQLAAVFEERPLDGEGATALFRFQLAPGPGVADHPDRSAAYDPQHIVAAGNTETNFFPAYGLSDDEAYSFHVGTRFMLGMGMQVVDSNLEPPEARPNLHRFIAAYAADHPIEHEQLAALFKSDEAYFAVYQVRLAGNEYYCMGADCPPGFYPLTAHPPQVALRLHIGRLIRSEAQAAQQADAERARPQPSAPKTEPET